MPTTKLSLDQRKSLLATGASAAEIQMYAEEGYAFAEILDLCETARDAKAAQAREAILAEADAHTQADAAQRDRENLMRPHSGVSFYNPAGGPMPKFRVREFFWLGDPLHASSTVTVDEIHKLNQLAPGEYVVEKTDGAKRIVKIFGFRDPATQQYERIEVSFPVAGQEKHGWPSLVQMCDQILAQQATRAVVLA